MKHADPVELLQEELAAVNSRISVHLINIGWRATRAAMDGKWEEHDREVENLKAAMQDLLGDEDPDVSCNCRERYSS